MSKKKKELNAIYAELTGITKISAGTFKKMCRFAENEFEKNPRLDYEYALVGISKETRVFVKKIDDYAWCEIDDEDHLKRAIEIIYPMIKGREDCEAN